MTTTEVKPDMVAAWLELQKNEVVPALKKAGVPWRWVFSTGTPFGQGFTFTIAQPVTNYAQFDQGPALQRGLSAEALASYNARVRPMIVRTHNRMQTLVQNASIVSFSGTAPSLAIVTTIQLLPGKGQEFAAITASDFVPALKKAGVTDYWVFATNFGGRNGERTIVSPIPNLAALDSPPALNRALGAEGAQKLNQKRQPLMESAPEQTVLRFVPDASYGAPAPPKR